MFGTRLNSSHFASCTGLLCAALRGGILLTKQPTPATPKAMPKLALKLPLVLRPPIWTGYSTPRKLDKAFDPSYSLFANGETDLTDEIGLCGM